MHILTHKFFKYNVYNKELKSTSFCYIAKAKRDSDDDIFIMLKIKPKGVYDFSWAYAEWMHAYEIRSAILFTEQDFDICTIASKKELLIKMNTINPGMFKI